MSKIKKVARKTLGFVLMELLVVIAVIAMMAEMFLPALSQAREKARQATCISNLKQIGIAMQMYGNDYHDSFPSTDWEGRVPAPAWLLGPYCAPPNRNEDRNNVWRCPSDPYPFSSFYSGIYTGGCRPWHDGVTHGAGQYYCSYAVNVSFHNPYYAGWGMGNSTTADYASPDPIWSRYRKLSEVTNPAGTIAFCEATNNWPGPPSYPRESVSYMVGSQEGVAPGTYWTSDRHSAGSNLLFVDGHAEWSKPVGNQDIRFKAYR